MSYTMIIQYANDLITNDELRAEVKVNDPKWWNETFRRKCVIDYLYNTGKIDLNQHHSYYKILRKSIRFRIRNYPFHIGFLQTLESGKPIEKII
jgi:hypothetical protein